MVLDFRELTRCHVQDAGGQVSDPVMLFFGSAESFPTQ